MSAKRNATLLRHEGGLPGFVSWVAIILWFLMAIIVVSPARADDNVVLTPSDILPEIETALVARGMPAGVEIEFAEPSLRFVAGGEPSFEHVSYSPASGRFVIRLAAPEGAAPAVITGFARAIETYPVLKAPVARGETIDESFIAWIEAPREGAIRFITDAADLVGMEARRPLKAGTPIRTGDVAAPVLVRKGALVTLIYTANGIRLTNQGIALNSGAEGDLISVKNTASDRTLKAVVDGENLARVTPRGLPQSES